MELSINYDGLMPTHLLKKIEKHTGEEIHRDFEPDDTGNAWFGHYFLGDDPESYFGEKETEDFDPEIGCFTREMCIDAAAFFDANCPPDKVGKWCINGDGGWACKEIMASDEYKRLVILYSSSS